MTEIQYRKRSVKDLSELKPGDHIRVVRKRTQSNPQGLYDHHMIVAEVISDASIKVIHYTSKVADAAADSSSSSTTSTDGATSSMGIVIEQEVDVEEFEVLEYPEHFKRFSPCEILERARSRLGEEKYGPLGNNCECFVNRAAIGQDISNQSGGVLSATVTFAAGAVKGYWNEGTFTGAMKGGVKESSQSYQKFREHRP